MSSDEAPSAQAKYPVSNTSDEALRLKAQHNLAVDALGGLVLCPVDLTKPNFKALDSATANGHFLRVLRQQLKHPESATLVGTDIMVYPQDNLDQDGTKAIEFRKQNVFDPWPEELHGQFDFVHQRALMANVRGHDAAVDVVRRLIQLVKPGGWIQLVDSEMPTEEISDSDSPGTKLWKTIGMIIRAAGGDPQQGTRLKDFLVDAGGVKNIESKSGVMVLGKGCTPGLEEDSKVELHGLRDAIGNAIKKRPNPRMPYEQFMSMANAALSEAEEKGITLPWYAVWAQRVE